MSDAEKCYSINGERFESQSDLTGWMLDQLNDGDEVTIFVADRVDVSHKKYMVGAANTLLEHMSEQAFDDVGELVSDCGYPEIDDEALQAELEKLIEQYPSPTFYKAENVVKHLVTIRRHEDESLDEDALLRALETE